MKIVAKHIKLLGIEIGQGMIFLQPHISIKIFSFLNKLEDTKSFLGLLNYARPYLKDIRKISEILYNKMSIKGQKYFNQYNTVLSGS